MRRRCIEKLIDEGAVDAFAHAMKSKLAIKREQGGGGWHDPVLCTVEHLVKLFFEHLEKGDLIDLANFLMMIWHREGEETLKLFAIQVMAQAIVPSEANR